MRKWGSRARGTLTAALLGWLLSQGGGQRERERETTEEGLREPCWDHEEVPADQEGLPRAGTAKDRLSWLQLGSWRECQLRHC